MKKLDFDYQKATQAINYFARKYPEMQINKMKVIKLIWLADRYHLRKYGRSISGDEYIAMKFGPVASTVKDIAENSDFLASEEITYSKQYIEKVDNNTIESVALPDMDVFSETDIEALNFAFKNFGEYDQFELANLSHYYPEWMKLSKELENKGREKMSYTDFFEDPINLADDKFKEEKDLLEESKEIFLSRSNINEALN